MQPTASFWHRTTAFTLTVAVATLGLSNAAVAGQPGFAKASPANAAAAAAAPAVIPEQWAPARALVQPRAGLPSRHFDEILRAHGGRSAGKLRGLGVHLVQLPPGASEEAVVRALARNPHIEFAELDRKVQAAGVPNDPLFGSAWHLAKINAASAWDISTGTGVTVAVLDSGINGWHEDLSARMVPGWNMYDNNADTTDVHGHGTVVAGAAAASVGNALGAVGVAGNARIMPIRISDPNAWAYWSTVAQGLTWAADHGAHIANISYNGVTGSSSIQNAAQYMRGKGGLVVVAAGNSGGFEAIAQTPTMITVSASDRNDARAAFSSYGDYVDVAAPGVDILTTARFGGYESWWGTSFASPIVAGTLAAMMSAKPGFKPADYEQTLVRTAVDLGAPGYDQQFGYGRIDAAAAVRAAAALSAPDTVAPTARITSPTGGTVKGLVAVDVEAADNITVARVELRVNGAHVGTDTVAPFGFSWDTTQVRDGVAALEAIAFDASGNTSMISRVNVTVANAVSTGTADTIAPVVTIANPPHGTVVTGKVQVSAHASDDRGAEQVMLSLYIDSALRATGTGSVSFEWNTANVSRGLHTIIVGARDAAGNSSTRYVQVYR